MGKRRAAGRRRMTHLIITGEGEEEEDHEAWGAVHGLL
jgi:hypothetical protein